MLHSFKIYVFLSCLGYETSVKFCLCSRFFPEFSFIPRASTMISNRKLNESSKKSKSLTSETAEQEISNILIDTMRKTYEKECHSFIHNFSFLSIYDGNKSKLIANKNETFSASSKLLLHQQSHQAQSIKRI